MTLKFVDGVEVLHNKYLTGCNFSYLQDFELWGGEVTVFLLIFTFEAYSALSCSLESEQLLIFNWDLLLFWPLNQHGKIKCFKARGEPGEKLNLCIPGRSGSLLTPRQPSRWWMPKPHAKVFAQSLYPKKSVSEFTLGNYCPVFV